MQVLQIVKPNLLTILAVQETNQRRFHSLILATSVKPDTELTCFFSFFFFSLLLFSDVLLLKMRVTWRISFQRKRIKEHIMGAHYSQNDKIFMYDKMCALK